MSGPAIGVLLIGVAFAIFGFVAIRWAAPLAHWNNTAGPAWLHRGQTKNTPRMWTIVGACFVAAGLFCVILALAFAHKS